MAYNAKINYEDVFSQVRMWDAIIYNHLRKKNIAIPAKSGSGKDAQFEGAYVKDPIIGLHKWVASFDLNSLYPHLIMQYNISPETLTEDKIPCTVEKLLNQMSDVIADRLAAMNPMAQIDEKSKIPPMAQMKMKQMEDQLESEKRQIMK
jgi:DNA polymerase elongation subunit (family B)